MHPSEVAVDRTINSCPGCNDWQVDYTALDLATYTQKIDHSRSRNAAIISLSIDRSILEHVLLEHALHECPALLEMWLEPR